MPSTQECQQLQEEFDSLSALREESRLLLEKTIKEKKEEDIARLEELKTELEKGKNKLKEKLWPFTELSRTELEAQYISQIEILEKTNLLTRLSDGKLGLRINNQEYPLPDFQEITRRFKEKKEILKDKISQGFGQIQITPLLSINTLKQALSRLLIEHSQNQKLFKTKRDPNDPDESLDLDTHNPVYIHDQFIDNPNLAYYPKAFHPDNHQGITKDRLITETNGFNVILIEKGQFLPQENDPKNLPVNGRKRIENNKNPVDYLNLQNTDTQYQNESYLTIEDWLTKFITQLEKTNQVSNDWHDLNASWLLGNYLTPTPEERRQNRSSGRLPLGRWYRDNRQARVVWGNPDDRYPGWGAVASVLLR